MLQRVATNELRQVQRPPGSREAVAGWCGDCASQIEQGAIAGADLEVEPERDAELTWRVRCGVAALQGALQPQAVHPGDVRIVLERQRGVQGGELRRVEDVIELQLQPRLHLLTGC